MRIRYRELPDGFGDEIRSSVERWSGYLPAWVHTLTVSYDDTDTRNYASAFALFEQRTAEIAFHPLFWSLDQQGRETTLLHEMAHVLMAPLDAAVDTIISTRPRKETAEKLWSDACEGFVNDFAALAWE